MPFHTHARAADWCRSGPHGEPGRRAHGCGMVRSCPRAGAAARACPDLKSSTDTRQPDSRRDRQGRPGSSGSHGLCSLAMALLTLSCTAGPALASYEEQILTAPAHLSQVQTAQPARESGTQTATPAASDASAASADQGFTGSRLLHRNGPKGPVPRLRSHGRDLPFAHALSLLTPRGWLALGAHTAPMTRVSWELQTPWLETLERLAGLTGTTIVLDWQERTFTVVPQGEGSLTGQGSVNTGTSGNSAAREGQTGSTADTAAGRADSGQERKARTAQAAQRTSQGTTPATAGGTTGAAVQATARAGSEAEARHLVSWYEGPGLVRLARDMEVGEAARTLGIARSSFMTWNGFADSRAKIARGTVLHVRAPAKGTAAGTASGAVAAAAQTHPDPQTSAAPSASAAGAQSASSASGTQSATQASATPGTGPVQQALHTARKTARQTQAKTAAQAAGKAAAAPGPVVQTSGETAPAGLSGTADSWQLRPGPLKQQVERWAARAGYSVVWQADTDLEMAAGAHFAGTFPEAVRALFEGLHAHGAPYTAHLFHGNHVLHIEDR